MPLPCCQKALVKLLSPVQRAAENVDFVKDLVDTGDVFHPLAWSPPEAYQLLKNASHLEEAGLLVRPRICCVLPACHAFSYFWTYSTPFTLGVRKSAARRHGCVIGRLGTFHADNPLGRDL